MMTHSPPAIGIAVKTLQKTPQSQYFWSHLATNEMTKRGLLHPGTAPSYSRRKQDKLLSRADLNLSCQCSIRVLLASFGCIKQNPCTRDQSGRAAPGFTVISSVFAALSQIMQLALAYHPHLAPAANTQLARQYLWPKSQFLLQTIS